MTTTNSDSENVEPIVAPDQTNGLAGNLEGDDGGVEPDEKEHGSLLGEVLDHGLTLTPGDQKEHEGDEGYSEEGHA
jgi:hypothetical protein